MVSSILFLGTQMTVGGAQRVLFNQAQWFHENGYQVVTAFFYDKDNLKEQWELSYPFPVVSLDAYQMTSHPIKNLFRLLGGCFRLGRLLAKSKIDVIETFTPDSNLLGCFVARLAGVPVRIASHHGYIEGAPDWRKRAHGWLVNTGFAQSLVSVSEQVRTIAINEENVHPERVKVIRNGIHPVEMTSKSQQFRDQYRDELELEDDDFIYLSVGRVTVQKGHTYLIDAVPNVLKSFPKNTIFLIAGEGHLREALQKKVVQMGLEQTVRFLGSRSDIPEILSIADVFVMPSLWEGLPLALLEAMSIAMPVVVSRVEGVESIIRDGENGYVLEPKDVSALSRALIKVRENCEEAQLFGERNKVLIDKDFTVDRMCLNYQDLFNKLYQQEMSK